MGIMSTLAHFPLEPGCEDFTFLGQVVEDLEQSLDSVFLHSIETSELDVFFEESDIFFCALSLWFHYLVITYFR